MRAKMGNVGRESIRKQGIPADKLCLLYQPSQQQCAVWVRGKGNSVEDDARRDTFLLIHGRMGRFETCSHTPSAESILGDIPHSINHGVKDVLGVRRTES